jgi:hypothetical protein
MTFKKDDLIILNDEGKKMLNKFNVPSKDNRVLKIINPNTYTSSSILWTHDALNIAVEYPVTSEYYRLATENEFKAYKIKSLFKHKGLD